MSESPSPRHVQHIEPEPNEGDDTENPLINELDFQIQVPNVLKVTMVDASTLKAYEEWAIAASILLNLAVGFTVAAATTAPRQLLEIVSLIFWALFLAASWKTTGKRRPVTEATRQVRYRLSRRENIRALPNAFDASDETVGQKTTGS